MNPKSRFSLLGCIKSVFAFLFGKPNWSCPPWLSYLKQKSKQAPRVFWATVILFIAACAVAAYALHWYKNQAQPLYVTASIIIPEITPNQEELVPQPLTINFGIQNGEFTPQSVAPISLIGKNITQGIEITPAIKGEWRWSSDSQLIFTPSEAWLAGIEYSIHTAPDFFTANTQLNSHVFSFTSKAFAATINEFKFYQDPVNSEARNAVATIEFNYPVSEESLKQNTSLMVQALHEGTIDLKAETIQFNYSFDTNKRIAYLHSEHLKIKEVARYLRLTLDKNIATAQGKATLEHQETSTLLIPDSSNFLSVISATASIIRNDKDRPEQVLSVETTLGVNERDFNKSVHLYLLPQDYPGSRNQPAIKNYTWRNPGEVSQAILALATPLSAEPIPSEHNYSSLHSFKFATQTPRYIYIKIDKGMRGFGNFYLSNDYRAVIAVPEYPKEISFLHKGSLLALNGEKKLSVLVRGLPAVKFDFARVLPQNINQLITQTQGDFNNPYFINPSFNQQNISEISSEVQEFDASDFTKQQYSALDLSQYLNIDTDNHGPHGLFLLRATGWDSTTNSALDVKASRLILVTDLALLVKDNNDGSHDVFVNSITQGLPVPDATVTVLGKNGLPILSRITDANGQAQIQSLKDLVDDREPVVYLASLNNDVSFIPFNNSNRQLNFSKFDIGGLYSNSADAQNLSAYLFSDRGIYRPGDTAHIGLIVKQAYAQAQPPGIPLQVSIQDPRGKTVKDEKISLDDSGYMELDFTSNESSPTGQYTVNLYLVKDNLPQNLLGSTSIRISEFQPDRMRITAELLPKPSEGWSSPADLKAEVNLWNLYGAPASDRKISAKLLLNPKQVSFNQYPDYVFSDPLSNPKKPAKVFTENLADIKTNDKGEAHFNLNLEQYEKATYQLTFFAEGFEAEGGRSVTTQVKTLVSPLPYFVGYKADGDLSFIKQNGDRNIRFIAINPQLKQEDLKGLKIELNSLHPVTTLVKNADGTFQYQSVIQSSTKSLMAFEINQKETSYKLPTEEIGDYALSVLDKDNTVLSQLKFTVVGASQRPLSKNAELSIKLNKDEFKAGEEIELQITAPYTGSGLITIERDKVYATQWFKTETTNSIQSIRIPADLQGNAYINVAFIRDWTSPELFISPLSYSVMPFSVSHEAHDIKIDLNAAKIARPGQPLTINYQSDKPGKIIVFAVDEGILQVARYETPDPLAFFFQKYALEVLTQQTVDQILPQFIQDRERSAVGGDDGSEEMASRLNPFKRKTDLPIAFWSGIIDTDTTQQQVVYHVPDYFNGTLKIMAVAVAPSSVGASETQALIRGDFIINPNVPTFVAPGDEFEVSASVANNLKNLNGDSKIDISLTTSPEIELIGSSKQRLEIKPGHEKTLLFKVRAKSLLGAASMTFEASTLGKSSTMDATLSVRPATPLTTSINSGQSKERSKKRALIQTFYPQYRTADASLSTNPLILIYGLQRYLDNYPYGCTEQVTSKAMPLIAMNSQPWFNADSDQISKKIADTINILSLRQMSQGGFSYWPGLGYNVDNDFASIYAMHFLTEAREQGFNVPNELFFNGITYLKDLASKTPTDKDSARTQAYAIYILTRNELVTTNYLANLQIFLQKDSSKAWQKDITSAYIAASYQLLKSTEQANQLIGMYQIQTAQNSDNGFYNDNTNNAQYLYLLAKHFPNMLAQVGEPLLMHLVSSMNSGEMNTLLSGYTALALSAYEQNHHEETPSLSITEVFNNNKQQDALADNKNYLHVVLSDSVKQIILNNPEQRTYFYQVMESGFDKSLPSKPITQGIELFREYRTAEGKAVSSVLLGEELEVHIQIRALDNSYLSNIAVEDLLPGGFEVVRDSVKTQNMNFADAREDRVNFFGYIDASAKELVYKIKATNPGVYTVPPAYAQAMYNPSIQALGVASKIEVIKAP